MNTYLCKLNITGKYQEEKINLVALHRDYFSKFLTHNVQILSCSQIMATSMKDFKNSLSVSRFLFHRD